MAGYSLDFHNPRTSRRERKSWPIAVRIASVNSHANALPNEMPVQLLNLADDRPQARQINNLNDGQRATTLMGN